SRFRIPAQLPTRSSYAVAASNRETPRQSRPAQAWKDNRNMRCCPSQDRSLQRQILRILPDQADIRVVKAVIHQDGELVAAQLRLDKCRMTITDKKVSRLWRHQDHMGLQVARQP